MGKNVENLHSKALPITIISTWYVTIHDIVFTNARLAAIHLTPTSICPNSGLEDTIQRRITDCGQVPVTWNWTRTRLGIIPRMKPTYIPKKWTIRPDVTLWPPQRHAAVLWLIVHLVHYRLQTHRRDGSPSQISWNSCGDHDGNHDHGREGPPPQEGT